MDTSKTIFKTVGRDTYEMKMSVVNGKTFYTIFVNGTFSNSFWRIKKDMKDFFGI